MIKNRNIRAIIEFLGTLALIFFCLTIFLLEGITSISARVKTGINTVDNIFENKNNIKIEKIESNLIEGKHKYSNSMTESKIYIVVDNNEKYILNADLAFINNIKNIVKEEGQAYTDIEAQVFDEYGNFVEMRDNSDNNENNNELNNYNYTSVIDEIKNIELARYNNEYYTKIALKTKLSNQIYDKTYRKLVIMLGICFIITAISLIRDTFKYTVKLENNLV